MNSRFADKSGHVGTYIVKTCLLHTLKKKLYKQNNKPYNTLCIGRNSR